MILVFIKAYCKRSKLYLISFSIDRRVQEGCIGVRKNKVVNTGDRSLGQRCNFRGEKKTLSMMFLSIDNSLCLSLFNLSANVNLSFVAL